MSEFVDTCMYGSARGQIDKHASGGSQVVCVEAGCCHRFVTVAKTPSEVKNDLEYHDWEFDASLSRWRCHVCKKGPSINKMLDELFRENEALKKEVAALRGEAGEKSLPTDGTDDTDGADGESLYGARGDGR